MNIYLLTHQRELGRSSNTGKLVADVLQENCRVIIWDRVNPDTELLQRIKNEAVALLFPGEHSVNLEQSENIFDSYILLDATWQQAVKMYNHSPYLKHLPRLVIHQSAPSIYSLRRNQKEQGLCTAESAITLLKHHRQATVADKLESGLRALIQKESKS